MDVSDFVTFPYRVMCFGRELSRHPSKLRALHHARMQSSVSPTEVLDEFGEVIERFDDMRNPRERAGIEDMKENVAAEMQDPFIQDAREMKALRFKALTGSYPNGYRPGAR